MNYQIVHAIEGRIRIRIPQLAEESFGQQLKSRVEQLKAVKDVRINPGAVSIVISYRDRLISSAAMQEELHHIIEQLLPPEPLQPPTEPVTASTVAASTVTTSPEPATPDVSSDGSSVINPSAINLDEDVWADSAGQVSASALHPETQIDPALALEGKTETARTETASAMHPLSEPADCTACSTALLAKRLGVSIQAINLRRSKPEFATWSQTKDPDGIAWSYQQASKAFVPVQADL